MCVCVCGMRGEVGGMCVYVCGWDGVCGGREYESL